MSYTKYEVNIEPIAWVVEHLHLTSVVGSILQ